MTARMLALACMTGAFVPLVWLGGCNKCRPDEPPPPLPATTSDAASEPITTVLEAGADVVDATDGDAADAKPKRGAAPSGLKPCCDALASNAENAPEPTKSYMKTAAAGCHAAVKQGQDKNAILAIVRTTLRGAGLPASCK